MKHSSRGSSIDHGGGKQRVGAERFAGARNGVSLANSSGGRDLRCATRVPVALKAITDAPRPPFLRVRAQPPQVGRLCPAAAKCVLGRPLHGDRLVQDAAAFAHSHGEFICIRQQAHSIGSKDTSTVPRPIVRCSACCGDCWTSARSDRDAFHSRRCPRRWTLLRRRPTRNAWWSSRNAQPLDDSIRGN